MKIFKPALLLTTVCALMLSGCSQNDTKIPENLGVDTQHTVYEEIDYTNAPISRNWYVNLAANDVAEIPNAAVEGYEGDETVVSEDIPEGNPIENYTKEEVSRLEEVSNVKIEYDGHDTLTLSSTAEDGAIRLVPEGEPVNYNNVPYESVNSYLQKIVVDDGVKHIGDNAIWRLDHPVSVTIPTTLESVDEVIFSHATMIDNFELSGTPSETDKVKVIDNALYVYEEEHGGWSLVKYATASTATEFKLPEEIEVVYIHKYAFSHNEYLTKVDLSNSPDIKIGNEAFNGSYAQHIILADGYDSDHFFANAGGCFIYYTIGDKNYTWEDLGYGTMEPNF